MGLFKRAAVNTDDISPDSASPERQLPGDDKVDVVHQETASTADYDSKWKLNKAGDGDAAMALFNSPNELHEPIDPLEEKKLVRKIDLMILPYLAVCYAL